MGRRKNAPRKRAGAAVAASTKKTADGKGREEELRAEEEAAGEEIDPDEPRYCVCGDVSFGTMICCENADVSFSSLGGWDGLLLGLVPGDFESTLGLSLRVEGGFANVVFIWQCEKEWFHLECVGLLEPPGRRAKWYCPECRVKFGKK